MAEIVPNNLIQSKHEASSSAGADMEKALLKNLQECLQTLLQLDPNLAERDVGSRDALQLAETSSIKTIPNKVLSKYLKCLDMPSTWNEYTWMDTLLEMVEEHPQLLMEVSPTYQRTFLHMAVIANSEVPVRRLLNIMLADNDVASTNSKKDHLFKHLQYLLTIDNLSSFTAYQMACVVGNDRIVHMIGEESREVQRMIGEKIEEAEQHEARIGQLGKVLKSCLKSLRFFYKQLKIMSLGDEFRLHTSLLKSDGHAISYWIKYDEFNELAEFLLGIIFKLAEQNLLSTFLEFRDNVGRHILHYLANLSHQVPSGNSTKVFDLIFTTLMSELNRHIHEIDVNVKDSVGRTPLHVAAAEGYFKTVEHFANDVRTDLNVIFIMSSCGVDRRGGEDFDVENIFPLSLAVAHNHFRVVKSLLNAPTSRKFQPLDVNLKTIKHIRLSNLNNKNKGVFWSPLQFVAFMGHVETLEVCLQIIECMIQYQMMKIYMLRRVLQHYIWQPQGENLRL